LEKVQMSATTLISNLQNKSNEERLRILDFPAVKLKQRNDNDDIYLTTGTW